MKFLKWSIAVLATAIVIAALVLLVAYTNSKKFDLQRVTFATPDLDERLEDLSILFVADIHSGRWRDRKSTDALVNYLNGLHADVIVLGGDYVGGKRKGADIFYPAAAHLYAPLGVYAIAGNHDYWENKSELADLIEGAGMTFLRNSSARLEVNGAGLWLAAVDDLDAGKPHLEKAYEEVDPDEFLIYLSHNPDFFEQGLTVMREDPNNNAPVKDSANAEVVVPDLALAGHTHGGQVTPFGILLDAPTSYGYRYLTGWRTEDKVPILVSNGVGVSVAPLRLGAPAQMHLFTLKRGKAKITTTTVKNVKL